MSTDVLIGTGYGEWISLAVSETRRNSDPGRAGLVGLPVAGCEAPVAYGSEIYNVDNTKVD